MTFLSAFGQHDQISPRDVDGDGFTEVSRRRLSASGVRVSRFVDRGRGELTFDLSDIRESRRGGDALDLPPHEALVAEAIESRRQSYSLSWSHGPGQRFDYRLTGAVAVTNRDSYYGTGRDPDAYGETSNTLALVDGQVNQARHHAAPSRVGQLERQPIFERAGHGHERAGSRFLG
jgi:outer membrane receptor for ferrienterochelin and colicins